MAHGNSHTAIGIVAQQLLGQPLRFLAEDEKDPLGIAYLRIIPRCLGGEKESLVLYIIYLYGNIYLCGGYVQDSGN